MPPVCTKSHPSKPHPCNMPQAKTEVALQFSECCAAETALQHWLFCSAEVIWTKSCAAANEKLQCNIEKAALQESRVFLPRSCGFQAPTFRHPRFGPAEVDTEFPCRVRIVDSGLIAVTLFAATVSDPSGTHVLRPLSRYTMSHTHTHNCQCRSNFSRKGFCRSPRGIFPNTKSQMNSAGDFLVDFFGPFSLEEKKSKNPPKKSNAKFQIRIWEFAAKIYTARIWP